MSGPTRADLEARIAELVKERDAWRDCGPQDAEAMAVARCVVALDKIKPRSGGGGGWVGSDLASMPQIGRVLRYLASRYGVQLVETQTEPCTRQHVDDLPMVHPSELFGRFQ